MCSMNGIAFFDLEVVSASYPSPSTDAVDVTMQRVSRQVVSTPDVSTRVASTPGYISQIGVWYEGGAWKGRSVHTLEQICSGAQYLSTGHIKAKSVIVVDEYQDISQREYTFLQVLLAIAGEVRIIVAGDDDQNIYEFRGSSVAFMRSFRQHQQAFLYTLTKNYRACTNLVDFSNAFLMCFHEDRLKAGTVLIADKQTLGTIHLHRYQATSSLIVPVVDDVAYQSLQGTIAILTATNEQILLVMASLRQKGIPARAIVSQEGFSLGQIVELKTFSHFLKQSIQNDLGYISSQDWQQSRQQMMQLYAASGNLPLALEVIDNYERTTGEKRYWSDWRSYVQQIRCEDFVMPEDRKVFVSTMHKAKGKEFDHVFLMLKGYPLKEEAQKRVVYVAITRAKQSLHIHTDQPYFDSIRVEQIKRNVDHQIYAAPEVLEIELTMEDVWLSYFKNRHVANSIKTLQAGISLSVGQDVMQGLSIEHDDCIVKFSQKFQQKLARFLAQGYTFQSALVSYIVIWYCKDDGKEYRVVLPKICLHKKAL